MKKDYRKEPEPIHLTEAGLIKLKDRLAKLKAALPGYIAETARTAAHGDRSENAEYAAAKGTLRRTHRLIFEIEDQLKRIVLIPEKNLSGKVEIGSTVIVEDENEREHKFQILGSAETNPSFGRISFDSPLGQALIGKKPGDAVSVRTPRGTQVYRIKSVG